MHLQPGFPIPMHSHRRGAAWRKLAATAAFVVSTFGAQAASEQPAPARSCTFDGHNGVFSPQAWSDRTWARFAAGDLGILRPEYDHVLLFIAWRRLAGLPLEARDIERLRPFDPCAQERQRDAAMAAAQQAWADARLSAALPTPPKVARGETALGYLDYALPNCNPDAFRTAAATLAERVRAHGAGDPSVHDWVKAQDLVLGLCFSSSAEQPAAVRRDAPAWLRKDRAYQVAAAHFYAGRYEHAARAFTAIAHDAGSPWQGWGRYLAARAWLRQATVSERDDATPALQRARALLVAQLAVPSLPAAQRHDAARLLQRVRLKLEPEPVVAEIDARLSAPALDEDVGQDLRDFDPKLAGTVSGEGRPSFARWLDAFRSAGAAVVDDAGASDDASLVALLQAATPQDLVPVERLEQAVAPGSPGFLTVQYHRIRLARDRRVAAASARALLAGNGLSTMDRNRIKALVLADAADAGELGAWAYREPVQSPEAEVLDAGVMPVVDADGADVLNRALPLSALHELLRSPKVPEPLRRQLLGVVWTRAVVLGRGEVLRDLSADMQARFPAHASQLRALETETNDAARRQRAAVFLATQPGVLGSLGRQVAYTKDPAELALPNMHPRLREDGNRENWWCSLPEGRYWHADPLPAPPAPPAFLDAQQRRAWADESRVLAATPDATTWLAGQVLAWADTHPFDLDLPVALRMLVRSSRGGCVTPETRVLGQRAFRHLKRWFFFTEAARQTRTRP
ncbi:hypothetical protein [Ramlibacter algicola]|uniref:hypothetical protein n=1 Tax=Ramlibacter algicola TaxID=2795217 RepID=UPI001EF083DC|nr:hypothetical protein [Ramlibacter algicola]